MDSIRQGLLSVGAATSFVEAEVVPSQRCAASVQADSVSVTSAGFTFRTDGPASPRLPRPGVTCVLDARFADARTKFIAGREAILFLETSRERRSALPVDAALVSARVAPAVSTDAPAGSAVLPVARSIATTGATIAGASTGRAAAGRGLPTRTTARLTTHVLRAAGCRAARAAIRRSRASACAGAPGVRLRSATPRPCGSGTGGGAPAARRAPVYLARRPRVSSAGAPLRACHTERASTLETLVARPVAMTGAALAPRRAILRPLALTVAAHGAQDSQHQARPHKRPSKHRSSAVAAASHERSSRTRHRHLSAPPVRVEVRP